MAQKVYNRNASSIEHKSPAPTYAESLLYQKGFHFQKRHHEDKIDLRRISTVDIDKIIEDVDLEELQSLLENITFAEITEDDFDLYSNDSFVKLFRINQLTLEYLLDVQDTLSENLNSLARKYASKKREVENLSKNLARQDAEVATLRDELHHTKEIMKEVESPTAVARLDACLFPSQERRGEVVTGLEKHGVSHESSKTFDSSEGQNVVQLNVVSSNHGRYLSLSVCPSITVQDLKKKLIEKLNNDHINSELWSVTFKGKHLGNPLQTINEAGIDADNNAIVLEISPQHVKPLSKKDIESAEIQKPEADKYIASSKLEDLVCVATMAHKELVEVSQTLQYQAGESVIAFIGTRLQNLESLLLEEVQRSIREAVLERSSKQINVDHNATFSPDTPKKEGEMTSVDDIDSDDGDEEIDKDLQVKQSNIDTVSVTRSADDDAENKGNKSKDTNAECQGPVCEKSTDIDPPHSFGPPTELNVTEVDNHNCDIKGEPDDDASGKIHFILPRDNDFKQESTNSVVDEVSTVVDPPSQGSPPDLVKHETDDTSLSPTVVSIPRPRSLKKIHLGAENFLFSEYESEDCISVDIANQQHGRNNHLSEICRFAPAVDIASVSTDSDMQSIEVSESEFRAVVDRPPKADTSKDADTVDCFGRKRLNKKGGFFKKIARRWMKKKSRGEKDLSVEAGKLYEV
ncbi:hypothetical protein ACHAW6_008358 [Cyclotella cf. meneghiniana]